MAKDIVSLLYVGNREGLNKERFSRDGGWAFQMAPAPGAGVAAAIGKQPDIILLDPDSCSDSSPKESILTGAGHVVENWIQSFGEAEFRFKPAFFLVVDKLPDPQARISLYRAGVDDLLLAPILPAELQFKARIYLSQKEMVLKQRLDKETQEKAFGYLDRFKSELNSIQKELTQEKHSLNNALKQIQHLTRERRQLTHRITAVREDLTRNMTGFEQILLSLIQSRVEDNRGHGRRVAMIALSLGKELGLDEKKLDDLGKAGMLHELGLLFMPEQAGDKNNLSSHGKNILIQYPVKGADLLSQCPGFEGSAGILRSLNENSDGTGYPDGLNRRYIPLASRILAGADEFDRLRDRTDMDSPDAFMKELEDLAGTRLDPVIVNRLGKYALDHLGSPSFRVKGVGLENLGPGMVLGTALFTAAGTKLFSVNTVLTQELIDKIIRYNREYPVDEIVYIKA